MNIDRAYFRWLCKKVGTRGRRELLSFLHSRDFTYTLPMDGNRESDGMNLRYRFGDECSYPYTEIASVLDHCPCSVLEMMVALSIRCEEQIMSDPDMGDRTGVWFWGMVQSLGLYEMTDKRFDAVIACQAVEKFLIRDYPPNGRGGLFTVICPRTDMSSIEIWYQMMCYLNERMEGRNA